MKHTILFAILALGTAACVPADQATLGGAATGALLGAAVSDSDDRVEGAIIGAAVGGVAGNLIGRANTPVRRKTHKTAGAHRHFDGRGRDRGKTPLSRPFYLPQSPRAPRSTTQALAGGPYAFAK